MLIENQDIIVSSENIHICRQQVIALFNCIPSRLILVERPSHLAKDPSTIVDVVRHGLEFSPDSSYIAVILPTSPFNSVDYIRDAIDLFKTNSCSRLLSVSKTSKPPYNAWILDSTHQSDVNYLVHAFPHSEYRTTKSTECPVSYMSNGCISIYSTSGLLSSIDYTKNVLAYTMPEICSIDIDHEFEFQLAQNSFSKLATDLTLFDS